MSEQWNNCACIYRDHEVIADLNDDMVHRLNAWLHEFPDHTSVWYDEKLPGCFGYNCRGGQPAYHQDAQALPEWFNFNADKMTWEAGYALNMFRHYFKNPPESSYGAVSLSEEHIITHKEEFSKFKDSKILVVGGGPSTLKQDLASLAKEYDYVFTCNRFYKNDAFKDVKVDLVLLSHSVELDEPDLVDHLENNKDLLIGFEHSDHRTREPIDQFLEKTDASVFLYLTRYFSRMGFASRALVLAAIFGAKQADIIGFDGFVNPEKFDHAFEGQKDPPPFYNERLLYHQAIILWDYLLTTSRFSDIEFSNLGVDNEFCVYSGIINHIEEDL